MTPITVNSLAHMPHGLPAQVLTVAAAALLAGCSSPAQEATPSSGASGASSSATSASAQPGPAPGISPGGVTTSVNAEAMAQQNEHYQACHAAAMWMAEQPGEPSSQIEPYLAMVQASATGGTGTWNTPWAELPAGRQAALIVAVTSAANGDCP